MLYLWENIWSVLRSIIVTFVMFRSRKLIVRYDRLECDPWILEFSYITVAIIETTAMRHMKNNSQK